MEQIMTTSLRYVAAGGGGFFIGLIFLLFVYVTVRYLVIKIKRSPHVHEIGSEYEKIFRSSLILLVIFIVAFIPIGAILDLINHASAPIDVTKASLDLMQVDHDMFGVYPNIWLHQSTTPQKHFLDMLYPTMKNAYNTLGLMISLLIIFSLALNPKILCQALVAFLLSFFASIPFWIASPAVTPNETFYSNKINAELPAPIIHDMETFSPTTQMVWGFQYLAEHRKTGEDGYYGITTNPSMHITWSVFVLYYGILLYRKFAIYLVPYFIVNAFSTVYLLQHFVIDVITGIAMGIFLILLIERATVKTPHMVTVVGKALHSDAIFCTSWFKSTVSRLYQICKN